MATGQMDVGVGGGSMESELGSALGDAFDAVTGDTSGDSGNSGDSADSENESLDAGGMEADASAEGGDPVQSEGQDQDPNAPVDAATGESPWPLSPDGQTVLMPKTELGRVQAAMTFADQVGQVFPSVQDAQSAAGQASDLRQITNDWLHGTDSAIQSFMEHWMGQNHRDPGARAACQRSFSRMLGMGVGALKQTDPTAHAALSGEIVKSHVSGMYDRAAQIAGQFGPDSDAAKQALLDAQSVDWGLNGTYQRELPKLDPAAQERARFEAQQREFNQRQEAAYRRDVLNFNSSSVEGAKFKQLDGLIDKELSSVRSRFNDVAYADLKAGISREIQSAVSARGDWYTEHRQNFDGLIRDYQTTWQNGSPGQGLKPRVDAYIQSYLREARRVLPAIASKRISATTQARVSGQTGSARPPARPQQPGGRRPSGPPSPAGQNGSTNGRISSDQWNQELAAALRI